MCRIWISGENRSVECKNKESILQALQREGMAVSAFCGGKGRCGKCRIRVKEGYCEITEADRQFFSEEELTGGCRLACRAFPEEDCVVELQMLSETGIDAVAEGKEFDAADVGTGRKANGQNEENGSGAAAGSCGIAVDIGTTTVVMQLIQKEDRSAVEVFSALNPQRSYGADVISRMDASNRGEGKALRERILRCLAEGFSKLVRALPQGKRIEEVVIAGNTTMVHLLMGYSCETLGTAPFLPVNIGRIQTTIQELFGCESSDFGQQAQLRLETFLHRDCRVNILPGISVFVGGDIVSGLLACRILSREKPCLFIDLGTNGEMALGNRERILVTSVAAGPAFEGGNISCGTGSIPGAICAYKDGKYQTIRQAEPVGICGTGVIEITAELRRTEQIDETGMMDEEIFEDGLFLAEDPSGRAITFTQQDVREVQLAKSAVRAGLETLLKRYGISYDEVEQVILAGGFGYYADTEKMIAIGMLPEAFRGKITAAGNTSLTGAKEALSGKYWEAAQQITEISEEVSLATDPDFQSGFMEYMYFESV